MASSAGIARTAVCAVRKLAAAAVKSLRPVATAVIRREEDL